LPVEPSATTASCPLARAKPAAIFCMGAAMLAATATCTCAAPGAGGEKQAPEPRTRHRRTRYSKKE
jgi:hypothetical protein